MSLTDLLGNNEEGTEIINGVLNAIVVSNKDPEGLGRVKLSFPLLGDKVASDWVRVASFFTGKDRGAFFLPKVDDEVLVSFLGGNVNLPYVIGCLWNGVEKIPVPKNDQQDVSEIKTKSGQVIRFEEGKKGERITITDKKNNAIVIDTKKNTITVTAGKDITVEAKSGALTLKGSTVTVQAKSSVLIKGAKIDIKATGVMNLKGKMININ